MIINITVCDDEQPEIAYLSALVNKWAAVRDNSIQLSCYESAENFLFAYGDENPVDVLLLDIQMKNMDGVELARHIRKDNEIIQIIFITGYADFIAEGYDVSALHYLIKPVKENKLFEVLDKAVKQMEKAKQILIVQAADATVKISIDDIQYIEAFAHYVVIQTKNAVIETRANISDIEKSVGNGFTRCHRSYLVGLSYISRINKTDIILDNGKIIPLSRRLYAKTNLAFIEYHKGRKI